MSTQTIFISKHLGRQYTTLDTGFLIFAFTSWNYFVFFSLFGKKCITVPKALAIVEGFHKFAGIGPAGPIILHMGDFI